MQRRKPIRSKKIRDSARGEHCTMQVPNVCKDRIDTTVFAHSNLPVHGKGMGQKADDIFGCYACFECHNWYDDSSTNAELFEEKRDYFRTGMDKTQRILYDKGLLVVK